MEKWLLLIIGHRCLILSFVNSLLGKHEIATLEDLGKFAKALADELVPGDVVLLSGNLGAGKTTFTQFLGKALGVEGEIVSPTYTLVGEYTIAGQRAIKELIHVDLYRTGDAAGAAPLNTEYIQEIFATAPSRGAVVVMEWGELFSGDLSGRRVWIIELKHGRHSGERSVLVRSSVA